MTSTRGAQDGSITTSLRELARLEERRVREEQEEQARLRGAVEAARRDIERRDAEVRAGEERKAEEAWLARVGREREESARLDAIRAATVERAQREAAECVAADERERQHRRDVELGAAMRGRRELRLARVVVAQLVVLALLAAGGAWAYEGVIVPREQQRARASEEMASRDRAIVALRSQLAARDEASAAARRDFAEANERSNALAAELARVRRELERLPHPLPKRAPVPTGERGWMTGFDSHCDPSSHDPLCANIGR